MVLYYLSPLIFKIKTSDHYLLLLTGCLRLSLFPSACLHFWCSDLYKSPIVYNIFLVFHIFPSFYIGSIFAKYGLFHYMKITNNKYLLSVLLLLLIVVRIFVHLPLFEIIYTVCFIFLLSSIAHNMRRNAVFLSLSFLGIASTVLWIVHFYVYKVYLDALVLKYPLLIFAYTIIGSLVIYGLYKALVTQIRALQ